MKKTVYEAGLDASIEKMVALLQRMEAIANGKCKP